MSEDAVEYETRTTQVWVGPKGEAIYNELGFMIEIDDDGGGEFIGVSSSKDDNRIRIDKQCWPTLRDAIDKMLKECREDA